MEELKGWSEFEGRLIYDRYSVREPKTGKRLEKTYEDVIDRITHCILSKDFPVDKEIIKTALSWARDRKLTFATPALMNLGNPYVGRKGYYSCFALGPVPDSTKEIFEYQNTCATIFQYAGGSGMDFSQLRAKNSPVDGDQGVSSGPCSFIELFEKVSNVIAAGGKRRGAELGQLDCTHPDIFDFVKIKQTNRNLPAINISVNVLDEFWENKELIDEIAKGMWLTGDPGLLFPDEMANNSPYPPKWRPLARYVNPCVVGNTRVSTNIGQFQIKDLADKFKEDKESFKVLNGAGKYTYPTMVEKTREDVEIWRVDFNDGHFLEGTKNHSIPTITKDQFKQLRRSLFSNMIPDIKTTKKSFKDLTPDDYVIPESLIPDIDYSDEGSSFCSLDIAEVLGFAVGNGSYDGKCLQIVSNDNILLDTFSDVIKSNFNYKPCSSDRNKGKSDTKALVINNQPIRDFLDKINFPKVKATKKYIPSIVFESKLSLRAAFLRGLFTADGTIYQDKSNTWYIRYSTSSKQLLYDIQLLLDGLGVRSYFVFEHIKELYSETYTTVKGEEHQYKVSPNYILQIDVGNLNKFNARIGFCAETHKNHLAENLIDFKPNFSGIRKRQGCHVVQVYNTGRKEDVYNITEPGVHEVVYSGLRTKNCGEYSAPPFSICNLLTGSAIGNTQGLKEVEYFEQLGYYMAYLGNCILWITLNNKGEGLPKESVHFQKMFDILTEIRPIGIGLTGLAEYLYSNNIKYNDTKRISKIYYALTRGSLTASSEWCRTTNQEAEWDKEYKEQHLDKIGYGGHTKFWNTTTTCQAPTGSVSQFLRCLSTGIEPLSSSTITRSFYGPDNLFHDVKLSSLVVEDDVKLDLVSIDDQLEVVSTIQNLMHTSASKTIIVPEETAVEDIKEIIYKAKDLKIKGLTVYRMGCSLDAIVKDHIEEESVITTKTKLPDVREGLTFKFRGMNSLYVTVNFLNNNPIEVFMASGKSGNVVNGLCMGLGRLASLALRSGTSVEEVVKSLEGISTGDFYINKVVGKADSISDALSKALHYFTAKDQIKDDEIKKIDSFDLCPQCGNYTLKKTGSCKSCTRCNFSTC